MQLQVVFVFVVVLLTTQAQAYLLGLPASTLAHVGAAVVPYFAFVAVAAVMCWAPWELPPRRIAAAGASVMDATSASREPEEATGGAEVEGREQEPAAEGDAVAERSSEHQVSVSHESTSRSVVEARSLILEGFEPYQLAQYAHCTNL